MTNPWYFSYDENLMSWIYLYLACYLTRVGTWLNQIPWDCNPLISWAISTSPSLYTTVVEDKEARNHSNISFDKFYVKLHDCHFGYTSALPCKTNPCRKMNFNYKGCSHVLMIYFNLSTFHKFNYMTMINATTQGMLFHLREALPQVMGQSNSTRCEYIKMLKRKMATPFWD